MRTKLRWRLLAMLAVLAMVAAACGSDDGLGSAEDCETVDDVRLQLQWVAQAQFAGYYVADDLDFYADECLNVTILEGAVEIVPQQVLATGGAEFGIAWVPKVLESNTEEGVDLVNIAQVFERSGTLMVSFADQGIMSVSDFAGHTVGNWGFGNEHELFAAMDQAGVTGDVTNVQQSFDMLALLNGEIDVAEAMIYNEYAQVLEAENPTTGELYQPSDLNVIDFNDVGTAMLQDAVWVNRDWIDEAGNQDIAERFLRASFRGWIHCLDEFDECVEVVLDNGSTLGESHQQWQLNEILGLIFPATHGIGVMDQGLWDQTVAVATAHFDKLQGVSVSNDTFRTDIAEAASATLDEAGLDVDGSSYERREIELRQGGE